MRAVNGAFAVANSGAAMVPIHAMEQPRVSGKQGGVAAEALMKENGWHGRITFGLLPPALTSNQPQLNSSGYCFCQWTKNKCKNLLPRNALHAQISTDA